MAKHSLPVQLSKSLTTNDSENILYVVLHGFISLLDIGDCGFIACLLDMGDVHAYLYGDWLFEKEVAPRAIGQGPWDVTLQLTPPEIPAKPIALVPGTNDLDPNKNLVFGLQDQPYTSDQSVRAILRLPRPDMIYYSVSSCVIPDGLKGTKSDIAKVKQIPDRICAVRVFEYHLDVLTDVALIPTDVNLGLLEAESILWKPTLQIVNLDLKKVTTLHVYDEPAERIGTTNDELAHSKDEFNKSLNFLKVEVELTKIHAADSSCEIAAPKLPGVLPEELLPLEDRESNVAKLLNRNRGDMSDPDPVAGSGGPVCSGAHASISQTPIPANRGKSSKTLKEERRK